MSVIKIEEELVKFGAVHSKELATTLRLNMALLYNMIPVGSIHPIMTNLAGDPDPNRWQLCDGSEILHPNSPLRSVAGSPRFTPNMSDKFIRITTSLGVVGNTGGVKDFSGFGHSHSTNTVGSAGQSTDSDKSGACYVHDHSHGINGDLYGTYYMEPPFVMLRYYMRIQ